MGTGNPSTQYTNVDPNHWIFLLLIGMPRIKNLGRLLLPKPKSPPTPTLWELPTVPAGVFCGNQIGMIFLTVGATLTTATEQSDRMAI